MGKTIFTLEDYLETFPKGSDDYYNYYKALEMSGSINGIARQLEISSQKAWDWKNGVIPYQVSSYNYIKSIDLPMDTDHKRAQYFGELFLLLYFNGCVSSRYDTFIAIKSEYLSNYFKTTLNIEPTIRNNQKQINFPKEIGRAMIAAGFNKREGKLPEWIYELKKGTLSEVLFATSLRLDERDDIIISLLTCNDYEKALNLSNQVTKILKKELGIDNIRARIDDSNYTDLCIDYLPEVYRAIQNVSFHLRPEVLIDINDRKNEIKNKLIEFGKSIKNYENLNTDKEGKSGKEKHWINEGKKPMYLKFKKILIEEGLL